MSIRNDAGATPAQTAQSVAMQQALSMHGMPEALQGVGGAQTMAPVDEMGLAEANTFNTNNPEHPLHRTLMVSIRASMNDLCLKKAKATWAPTGEAMKNILQQKKFVDLAGSAESQGDLKSIVLHKMSISSQKNDFPLAVGMRVSGVDDAQFSVTGEPFSSIALSGANTNTSRTLQEDDVSLAYEFSRKFPGYTAENLTEKGIHEVSQRRFCLVAADHPLVSAISENAERLQMGEISMMPEGLVKISSSLYETIMPMVKAQVESQIKVKDLSKFSASIAPAEHASWHDARTELMAEAKAGLKARLETALSGADDDSALADIRARFENDERDLEHSIDHTVHQFSCTLDVAYNFLSS